MKNLLPAVAVFAVSIASLSLGSVLLKIGMDRYGAQTAAGASFLQALSKTPELSAGVVLMLVQFAGTMALFKWGWDASVVIPVLGLSYVLTTALGKWMLNEPVSPLRWMGVLLIIAGVFCVARSVGPAKIP